MIYDMITVVAVYHSNPQKKNITVILQYVAKQYFICSNLW